MSIFKTFIDFCEYMGQYPVDTVESVKDVKKSNPP